MPDEDVDSRTAMLGQKRKVANYLEPAGEPATDSTDKRLKLDTNADFVSLDDLDMDFTEATVQGNSEVSESPKNKGDHSLPQGDARSPMPTQVDHVDGMNNTSDTAAKVQNFLAAERAKAPTADLPEVPRKAGLSKRMQLLDIADGKLRQRVNAKLKSFPHLSVEQGLQEVVRTQSPLAELARQLLQSWSTALLAPTTGTDRPGSAVREASRVTHGSSSYPQRQKMELSDIQHDVLRQQIEAQMKISNDENVEEILQKLINTKAPCHAVARRYLDAWKQMHKQNATERRPSESASREGSMQVESKLQLADVLPEHYSRYLEEQLALFPHRSLDDLLHEKAETGMPFYGWARDLLDKTPIAPRPEMSLTDIGNRKLRDAVLSELKLLPNKPVEIILGEIAIGPNESNTFRGTARRSLNDWYHAVGLTNLALPKQKKARGKIRYSNVLCLDRMAAASRSETDTGSSEEARWSLQAQSGQSRRRKVETADTSMPPPRVPDVIPASGRADRPCGICSRVSHTEEECADLWRTYFPPNNSTNGIRKVNISQMIKACYNCGASDHWGDNCPRLPEFVRNYIGHGSYSVWSVEYADQFIEGAEGRQRDYHAGASTHSYQLAMLDGMRD